MKQISKRVENYVRGDVGIMTRLQWHVHQEMIQHEAVFVGIQEMRK